MYHGTTNASACHPFAGMSITSVSRRPPAATPASTVTWVRPRAPRPSTLPVSSSVGRSAESSTSMTRDCFSSTMPWATHCP